MKNLWNDLPKPFLLLAPMAGATDTVFRQIVTAVGKPDAMMTEFLCVDQLYSFGSRIISQLLEYDEVERSLIAQIWGTTPELFYNAAQMVVEFGFDGVDINMGCPEKSVVKGGACSALVKTPELAKEIIQATKEGAAGKIPVSVKCRIGYDKIVTEEWTTTLLSCDIDALTVHGRTTKEMSRVPCHWDEIGKVVGVRDQLKKNTKIIGNGDVESREEALAKVKDFGVDGVMIGRGVFHDPYIFHPEKSFSDAPAKERLTLLLKHVELHKKTWENEKNFAELKRFFKIYVNGFDGAAELRHTLMQTNYHNEVLEIVRDLI